MCFDGEAARRAANHPSGFRSPNQVGSRVAYQIGDVLGDGRCRLIQS